MKQRFEVIVSLRQGLADPAGRAVEESLPTLGFEGVSEVRIGKHIEMSVEAADVAAAMSLAAQVAEQVLSNPVIEDVQVVPVDGAE
jgi:phosphoribosylformylglycinamidine synthase PurS subunit